MGATLRIQGVIVRSHDHYGYEILQNGVKVAASPLCYLSPQTAREDMRVVLDAVNRAIHEDFEVESVTNVRYENGVEICEDAGEKGGGS